MRESERCQHPDCIYWAGENLADLGRFNCNFAFITGRTRIRRNMSPGEMLPCNCREYIPSGRPVKTVEHRVSAWHEEALRLHIHGLSVCEIGEKLDKHSSTVRHFLHRMGLHPNKKERKKVACRLDWKLVEKMFRAGKSDREIAEALGCTQSSVSRWRNHE